MSTDLLLTVPISSLVTRDPPLIPDLGLGYVAAGCQRAGLSVQVIDWNPRLTVSQYRRRLRELSPRVVGIKESSAALGGVAGPLLVVGASTWTTPQGVFLIAGALVAATCLFALFVLRPPRHVTERPRDVDEAVAGLRAMAAGASLRGLVMQARAARGQGGPT